MTQIVEPTASMADLWAMARTYGMLALNTSVIDSHETYCLIDMLHHDGVSLLVTSGCFRDPCDALADAIEKARKVKGISLQGADNDT